MKSNSGYPGAKPVLITKSTRKSVKQKFTEDWTVRAILGFDVDVNEEVVHLKGINTVIVDNKFDGTSKGRQVHDYINFLNGEQLHYTPPGKRLKTNQGPSGATVNAKTDKTAST